MKANITQALIRDLGNQDLTIFDTGQRGLQLRLRASGAHSWRVQVGRGRFLTLGRADAVPPAKARELARSNLGKVADGRDPVAEKRAAKAGTFAAFLDNHYGPWARENLKGGEGEVARLRTHFGPLFGAKPMSEISAFAVERWRTGKLKAGLSKATINRVLARLRAALTLAVRWKMLPTHPLRDVRQAKADSNARVRFLDPSEEARLREALAARDEARRAARERFNEWRRERGYKTVPDFGTYTDHLTPIVLLAMNTGLRRGELFDLEWSDVDLVKRLLTVRGEAAKSGVTRHVPLNDEALAVLQAWGPRPGELVFPSESGERLVSLKTAFSNVLAAAKIEAFRFHDTRHHFASRLVQARVDLATVRALLGHSDFRLTLRYSHLAPENLTAAVATLNRG